MQGYDYLLQSKMQNCNCPCDLCVCPETDKAGTDETDKAGTNDGLPIPSRLYDDVVLDNAQVQGPAMDPIPSDHPGVRDNGSTIQ